MSVKQLSVFIENRQGRLGEVLSVLKNNNINILSLSLADTTEYGLLRLIVNSPEVCRDTLQGAGFSSMLTDVLVVEISHSSGSLQNLMQVLAAENISVEYMYGLSIDGDKAYVVIKTSDMEGTERVFRATNVQFLDKQQLANM